MEVLINLFIYYFAQNLPECKNPIYFIIEYSCGHYENSLENLMYSHEFLLDLKIIQKF